MKRIASPFSSAIGCTIARTDCMSSDTEKGMGLRSTSRSPPRASSMTSLASELKPSAALYTTALHLKARWQLAFYDSLIVAAALEAGCKRLLTEDLQDGQRIEGLRIENPFKR